LYENPSSISFLPLLPVPSVGAVLSPPDGDGGNVMVNVLMNPSSSAPPYASA